MKNYIKHFLFAILLLLTTNVVFAQWYCATDTTYKGCTTDFIAFNNKYYNIGLTKKALVPYDTTPFLTAPIFTKLKAGLNYNFKYRISTFHNGIDVATGIYFDFNKDRKFDDKKELLDTIFGTSSASSGFSASGIFKIPMKTPTGIYRMRYRSVELDSKIKTNKYLSPNGACKSFLYGSVIDFPIFIQRAYPNDVAPLLIWPNSQCGFSSKEVVKMAYSNLGYDTLPAGDTLYTHLALNGTIIEKDTIYLTKKMYPKDTLYYTFTKTLDLSKLATYQITASVGHRGDSIPSNDTLNVTRTNQNPITQNGYFINFDSSLNLPNGWENSDNDGGGYWKVANEPGLGINQSVYPNHSFDHTKGRYAGKNFLDFSAEYNTLQDLIPYDSIIVMSPCFDVSGFKNPTLEFWTLSRSYGPKCDLLSVDIQYPNKLIKDVEIITSDSIDLWRKHQINLSKYLIKGGGAFKIRFRGYNSSIYGRYNSCAIDDVKLFDKGTNDVGVVNIITPKNNLCGDSLFYAKINVYNFGLKTQTQIPIILEAEGIKTKIKRRVVDTFYTTLQGDSGQNFTFKRPINLFTGDNYKFSAYTQLPNDSSSYNDTFSESRAIRQGLVIPIVTGNILCTPGYATLKVTNNSGFSTRWHDSIGNIIAFGVDSLVTPIITSPKKYYVSYSNEVKYTIGRASAYGNKNSKVIKDTKKYYNLAGLTLNTTDSVTIDSAMIYPEHSGWLFFNVRDSIFGNLIKKDSQYVTVKKAYDSIKVKVGLKLPKAYWSGLTLDSSTVGGMIRNEGSPGYIYSGPGLNIVAVYPPVYIVCPLCSGTPDFRDWYSYIYNIQYRTAGCYSNLVPITVGVDSIKSSFKIIDSPYCESKNIRLVNTSKSKLNFSLTKTDWILSNGSTFKGDTINIKVSPKGSYFIKMTTQNLGGCASSSTRTFNIENNPIPKIYADLKGRNLTLTAQDSLSKNNYNWNFGNGYKDSTSGFKTTYRYTLLSKDSSFKVKWTITSISNGCKSMGDTNILIKTTDLQTAILSNNLVKINPNPFKDELFVDFGKLSPSYKIQLIDANGKSIYVESGKNKSQVKINSHQIKSGLYFIIINDDQIFKVIKE